MSFKAGDPKQGVLKGIPLKGEDIYVASIPLPTIVLTGKPIQYQASPIQIAAQNVPVERFWSSQARSANDTTTEVIEITFAGSRLINHVSFLTAHFPHAVTAEYFEEASSTWKRFVSSGVSDSSGIPIGYVAPSASLLTEGLPVEYAVRDSVPSVISSQFGASSLLHPQHQGVGHWVPVSWRVKPTEARRVRLRLQRLATGAAPTSNTTTYTSYPPAPPIVAPPTNAVTVGKATTVSAFVQDFGYQSASSASAFATALKNANPGAYDANGNVKKGTSLVIPVFNEITKKYEQAANPFPSNVQPYQGGTTVSTGGGLVPYSLAVKDWQVGYRINTKDDSPRITDIIATSPDLFGSRVSYQMQEKPAPLVLDGDVETSWRSNPQPVGYSIVNFYADVRTDTGDAQVIDRFYMDPQTVGVHINLYSSSDDPLTHYEGSDDPILAPVAQPFGTPLAITRFGADQAATEVVFAAITPSFVDVDNGYLQFDPTQSWWVGIQQRAIAARNGTVPLSPVTVHPWLSFSGHVLRQNGTAIEFVHANGHVVSLPLPAEHTTGSVFSVAVIYNPADTADFGAGITIVYRGWDALVDFSVTDNTALVSTRPDLISIGRGPVFASPGIASLALRALVIKDREPAMSDIDWFLGDSANYVVKETYAANDTGSTANAVLRMSPSYSGTDNVPGIVGGAGDVFRDMVWAPVPRDYRAKKGFLTLPPTQAKYFKFEFTNLSPESYESFVPIRRQIKLFSQQTVARYNALWGATASVSDEIGVQASVDQATANEYLDAVSVLRTTASDDYTATDMLVVPDMGQRAQASSRGWVWGFQPWQLGNGAPRFVDTQQHIYDLVTVDHRTKIGYFVGLRTLRAYRANYLTRDDTGLYVEHFYDTAHITSQNNIAWTQYGVRSQGAFAEMVSGTFLSHRPVRAVQFASIQTDAHSLLSDEGFRAADMTGHWFPVGDATLQRKSDFSVDINRGWNQALYGTLESTYPSYGAMEGIPYGALEGGVSAGSADGGIRSEYALPANSGRLYAAARVTARTALTAPVVLEIVSYPSGIVLASTSRTLGAGQTADMTISYAIGSAAVLKTYGNIETTYPTYGAMNGVPYSSLESTVISGQVFVRLRQTVGTHDVFTAQRLSLFDDPIAWQFSADGGATWYDAMDARNNVNGALVFPAAGTQLRWRLRMFRQDSTVTALAIRPWYAGYVSGPPTAEGLQDAGPNTSPADDYPPIDRDPMWAQTASAIPSWWSTPLGSTGSVVVTSTL